MHTPDSASPTPPRTDSSPRTDTPVPIEPESLVHLEVDTANTSDIDLQMEGPSDKPLPDLTFDTPPPEPVSAPVPASVSVPVPVPVQPASASSGVSPAMSSGVSPAMSPAMSSGVSPAMSPVSQTPPPLPATPPVGVSTTASRGTNHLPPSPVPVAQARTSQPIELQLRFSLPNGSVGKPYDAQRTCELTLGASRPRGTFQRIEGLTEIGLQADIQPDRIRITGTPTQAGDHPIQVYYSASIPISGSRIQSAPTHLDIASAVHSATLTINPDPRSLWKDLEPATGQPFVKPHVLHSRLKTESAVLLGASRRGRSHAHEGKFREDDFRLGQVQDWSFVVVADGAGSAKFSRRGSELACETVCQQLQGSIPQYLDSGFDRMVTEYHATGGMSQIPTALYRVLGGAAHAAYKKLEQEAAQYGNVVKDFASTLNVTILKRYDCGYFAATFAVGDGGVAAFRTQGITKILNTADSGEYAGQTRFLTMPEIWTDPNAISARIQFTLVPDLTAIFAMTDGVSDPKFSTDKNFADPAKWAEFWADLGREVTLTPDHEPAAAELLEWLQFWSTGNHDDRTLALMLPTEPAVTTTRTRV